VTDDLAFLDAHAQAALVRDRDLSEADLLEATIARIEKLDPEINAVIHPLFDRARAVVAAGVPDGPFRGVPIVVKDYDGSLAGAPLHMGNRALAAAGHTGTTTSYLFEKLERAGFVIVGKTNTPEFGLLPVTGPVATGPSRNPWNPDHTSGGSSGGSGAAVAAGMVPVAHGGDGGGSIRIPASMCGLFGLKPSRGRVSLGPDQGEDWCGLVQRHALTRSVRDSAAVLDAIQGAMPGDPYTAPPPVGPYADDVGAPPGRLRIGVRTAAPGGLSEVDPVCAAAAQEAGRFLESLGHHVEEAAPAAFDVLDGIVDFITVVASFARVDVELVADLLDREVGPDDFETFTWAQAESGRTIPAAALVRAERGLHRWTRQLVSWWDDYDLLLTPTLAITPPPVDWLHGGMDDPAVQADRATPIVCFTMPFNVTGQPAASVPWTWTDQGLPVGVQLVGNQYREDVVLRVSAQIEAARPWADRTPAVSA
jgi:amidase